MKNLIRKWALGTIAVFVICLSAMGKTPVRPDVGISFQVFYDNLKPYGRWINDRAHGYVWIPDVEPGFQPYATRGHWIMTNYGNTWVSDYAWGWAPFHYGRWRFDDFYGWEWIPGDEWGPAWVNWRSGNGYYGWSPMEPGIHINVSINIPLARWVFVPQRYICHPQIYNYYSPRTKIKTIIHNTTVINNVYVYNNRNYVSGPGTREIERVTRTRVPVYRVNNNPRPGYATAQNGSIGLYRPQIDRTSAAAVPSQVADAPNNRNNSPDRNGQAGNVYGNPPNSSRPDRVSNSQPVPPGQPENRDARIDNNSVDQTPGNRPAAESKDVYNRQAVERVMTAPNTNRVPDERTGRGNSQPNRVEEKRENVNNIPGRFSDRQSGRTAPPERINTEQSRSRRQAPEQQSRPAQRSREQSDQRQQERGKEQQAPSGRDGLGRQRPGRV